ncbi:ABC transporter substrate-binding protein [Arthrobacter sp. W4I7]|uniref:ABC transporter substrate-binding protein n=1 Tax=Arthrobacter sp. W4I7 TaxID=3042296 RepID=UPI00277E23FE|nr:ABC transporter substrate-binding protein [Arthrobacter sp. W4I7]MDQ0691411.1 ABC-type branched-subunit amino acid transport system substrate-binding protein [Arthrobacter sp. W4I7]
MKNLIAAGLVALSAGLSLTACSVSNQSSDLAGGLSAEPIKLMAITATGGTGTTYESDVAGARASVRAINARGGIHGRPLELLYCNERSEAAAAEQCAREAVKEDVLAVVAMTSSRGAAQIYHVLEAADIPVLGATALSTADYTSPVAFNVDGGAMVAFTLCPTNLAMGGATKQAMVRADLDVAAGLEPLVAKGIDAADRAEDSKVVLKIPASATDYSGYIRQLKDAGVTGVTSAVSQTTQVQLLQTAETLGSDMKVCADTGNMSPETLAQLGAAADRFYTVGLPPIDPSSSVPGVAQFVKDVEASITAGDQWAETARKRPSAMRGWVGPRIVERVASSIDGELTSESFLKSLRTETALDVDMFGTIDFASPGKLMPSIRNLKGYLSKWSPKDENYVLTVDQALDASSALTK